MPQVPILGNVNKPTLVIAIGAGVAVAGYAWYKHNKSKAASQAAATATGPNQSGTYGYGTYGYGAYTYEPYGYGFGPSGLGNYGNSGSYFGYGYYGAGTPVPTGVPTQATNNAQWSQAAVSALTQGGNYSATTVLAALGIYLMGGTVSADQETIVQSAIAAEGYPPVSGPNGFPPAINTAPPAGQGGGGTPPPSGGGNSTVPNLIGESKGSAFNTLKSLGFKPADGNWTVGSNAKKIVKRQSPNAGTQAAAGSKVTYWS